MHYPAAVDVERLAGDEARLVRDQEGDGGSDVGGDAASLHSLMVEHEALIALGIGMDRLGIGREGAGRDRVDGDAVAAELARWIS